jgi:hypothetical protein
MKLPGTSRRKDPGQEARIAFRLQSLRFRKMLETANALFGLLEDGREKMAGDYILDRHYVESLADEVIDKAGSVVFDACVLVEEGGEDLFAQYDAHRSRARGMLVAKEVPGTAPPRGKADGGEDLEPEYRLLSGILEWIDGRSSGSGETLMAFMRRVLDHVANTIEEPPLDGLKTETIQCSAGGVNNSIRLVNTDLDLPEPENGSGAGAGAHYRPIRLMCEGAAGGGETNDQIAKAGERTWLAVVNERHMSLRRIGASSSLRVEVCLGDLPDTGMLFLHASDGADLETRLPAGFRIEREEGSLMAWLEDARGESIEEGLVRLGRLLFA